MSIFGALGGLVAGDPVRGYQQSRQRQQTIDQGDTDLQAQDVLARGLMGMFGPQQTPGAIPQGIAAPQNPLQALLQRLRGAVGGQGTAAAGAPPAGVAMPPSPSPQGAPPAPSAVPGAQPVGSAGAGGGIFPGGGQMTGAQWDTPQGPQGMTVAQGGGPAGAPPVRPQPPPMPAGGQSSGQPTGQPGGGGSPQPGGSMTMQQLVQGIIRGNPGIQNNPRLLAAAVTKAIPLLNAQDREQALMIRNLLLNQQLQTRSDAQDLKEREFKFKQEQARAGIIDDEAISDMADSYLTGNTSVVQNLGRGAQSSQNISRLWNDIAQKMQTQGLSGKDIAAAKINFTSQTAGARTAATRAANISTAVNEALQTFPLGRQASEALPRTQFVPYNRAVQMWQAGTSSPQLARFVTANQAIITAYSQAMSRTGTNTVHAQARAEMLLSTATSPEAYNVVLDQMEKEMHAAEVAPEMVRDMIMQGISGRGMAPLGGGQEKTPTPAAPAPAATGNKPKQVIQNGHTYDLQPDGSYK